ncbi:MAG: DMT family transporter [Candidatus Bipolaricaulia bacterium]
MSHRDPIPFEPLSRRASIGADLLLLGVAVIWGWTFVLVKEGVSEVGPLTFLFYRFGIAFVALALLFRRHLRGVARSVWLRGIGIGLALFGGYWFQTWGLVYTAATKSAFITGLSVVIVPLMGTLMLRERISGAAWLGAGLSAVGLALLVFGTQLGFATVNVGDALTLVCAISFATQILLVGRYTRPSNHLPILVAQIGVVAALSGVGWATVEGAAWTTSWTAWKGILITAVLATAVAYWLQNRFQPYSTAARAAIIYTGEPVFAGVFGVLLLGERLTGGQWLGAALILGAMVLAQWPTIRRISRHT